MDIDTLLKDAEQAKAAGNRQALALAIAGIFSLLPEAEVLSIMAEWAST